MHYKHRNGSILLEHCITGTGVKLLLQVLVGQWSRIDLGSKSMVKLNFSQVNTLTAVADYPTVSMFVTPSWNISGYYFKYLCEPRRSRPIPFYHVGLYRIIISAAMKSQWRGWCWHHCFATNLPDNNNKKTSSAKEWNQSQQIFRSRFPIPLRFRFLRISLARLKALIGN